MGCICCECMGIEADWRREQKTMRVKWCALCWQVLFHGRTSSFDGRFYLRVCVDWVGECAFACITILVIVIIILVACGWFVCTVGVPFT